MPYKIEAQLETGHTVRFEVLDDDGPYDAYRRKLDTIDGLNRGLRMPPELVPRRFRITQETMPTHGFFPSRYTYIVDQRFVDAIERREPGAHRFFEIDIRMADGRPLERPHYLLNCLSLVDACDVKRSDVKIKGVMEYRGGHKVISPNDREKAIVYHYVAKASLIGLYLLAERIAGHAMWWDYNLRALFVSDAVWDEITAAGVEGMRHFERAGITE